MPERTAGSLSQSDTAMNRTVAAEGRLIGLVGIAGRVHVTLELASSDVVEVGKESRNG